MTPDRWRQIEEIFQAALDLAPAERARFIKTRTAGDEELKSEIEKLLADFDSAEDFIESPVWTDSGFLDSAAKNAIENSLDKKISSFSGDSAGRGRSANDSPIGRRIGAYELEKEIGRGGMGAVYLAERVDGEFRQKVAIKLIKRGMDTDFVLKRFRRERQILANLNHPNIVLLIDGGTTPDGLPYFVMDYVEGEPLRNYCQREKLGLRERLELFRAVCEAVDYAHQKKVVHRDLKPSNILVNRYGLPKLLDFGIAKLLDPEQAGGGDTQFPPTETHVRLMTPEYASPEQVSGGEITPASDIYALGVLLYELVAGQRPHKFPKRAPHEVARIICEEEPARPSDVLREKDSIDRITAELDKIILKALRKDPAERYETAADLSADLLRFLENRPVKARFFAPAKKLPRESPTESRELSIAILPFKLFGSAEKESTGGGNSSSGGGDEYLGIGLADALVMRLSGVKRLIVRPTSSALRFGETVEPFRAGRELGVDFIVTGNVRRVGERIRVAVQLLKVSDEATDWAETFDEKSTDVLELEDSISEKIAVSLLPYLTGEERRQLEKRGTNSPQAYEAFLRGRFNWSLQSEEGFARAIVFYRRAVELDPAYAQAYAAIAEYYIFLGIHCVLPFGEGARAAKQAGETAIRLDPMLADGYAALGFAVLSFDLDWEKAENYFKRALEINPNSTSARFWQTALLAQAKRFDEALEQLEELHEIDPDSLLEMHMLAWILYHARRYDESIAAHLRIFKAEPNYAWGLQTYSWVLRRAGRYREAVAEAEKAVRLTGGANPFYLTALAAAHAEAGDRERAETMLGQLAELAKTRFVSEYMLALIYCALGEKERAFEYLEKSLAARDGWTNWLGVEPQFDILRDDPRFADLLRRSGNPLAAQTEKIPSAALASDENPTTIDSSSTPILISGAAGGAAPDLQDSVAVLPLKVLGGKTAGEQTDEEFLGIGLTDTLIMKFSQLQRFAVRPTSSVMRFHGRDIDPFEAGGELGVRYVLDGNLRRSGGKLRVTLRLLDTSSQATVWAEQFNGTIGDIFALEDEISEQVAKSLLPQLSTEEQKRLHKHGTDNAEAYEYYLRGRFHWNQFSLEGFSQAFDFYRRAVEIAPDYALAYAGLADYYNFLGVYTVMPFAESSARAKEYALRAVALDSSLAEAYASLGFAVLMHDFDWRAAEEHLRLALRLNPNYVLGRVWYCYFLGMQRRFDEAFAQIEEALRLDSVTPIVPQTLNWTFYYAHRYDESIAATRRLLSREPNYGLSHIFLSLVLSTVGRSDEAIGAAQKAEKLLSRSPYTLLWLAATYAAANRREETFELLAEIRQMSAAARYVSPYLTAMVYVNLGDRERAFAELEKAVAIRDARLVWIGVDPAFDSLRSDARFQNLLRRTGNPLAAR